MSYFKRILWTDHFAIGLLELSGHVGKTKTGQLSVFITDGFELLAPCLHHIPTRSGLKDPEKRFRNRHLDFLVNREGLENLRKRSQVMLSVCLIQGWRWFYLDYPIA
jgi:lysyl-tRNA synthetase class II